MSHACEWWSCVIEAIVRCMQCHVMPCHVKMFMVMKTHVIFHMKQSNHATLAPCRDPTKCQKNIIEHYKDRNGTHADLKPIHFKYSKRKGPQCIPLAPGMVKLYGILEQAIASKGAKVPSTTTTLFHMKQTGQPYKAEYFSTYCGNQLVFKGKRLPTRKLRHMFITGWRDFIHHPSTYLLREAVAQVEEATSGMMLNSRQAWDSTYDDSALDRSLFTTLVHWPKFQEFMKQQYLDKSSKESIDPTTFDFSSLGTWWHAFRFELCFQHTKTAHKPCTLTNLNCCTT